MEKFDYEDYYDSRSKECARFVREIGVWKARILEGLIGDEPVFSVLEIGTGPGDVLNAFGKFRIKIGIDMSENALRKHADNYFTKPYSSSRALTTVSCEFDLESALTEDCYYQTDGRLYLLQANADEKLPLKDKAVDFVVLCDLVEHIHRPELVLLEACRVGKHVLLKLPVEKAVLPLLALRLRGVEYGEKHPSGHLKAYSVEDYYSLFKEVGLKVVRCKFLPVAIEHSEQPFPLKRAVFRSFALLDQMTGSHNASKRFIGGDLFALCHGSQVGMLASSGR